MTTATRTPHTVTSYLKRAAQLGLRAKADRGLSPDAPLAPADFVAWAVGLRPSLSRSSWRQYKAALSCFLESQGTPDGRLALIALQAAWSTPCKRVSGRTSAQKERALRPADFKAIRTFLLASEYKWAHPTLVWLAAGLLTGLRPLEWYGAQLVDGPSGERQLQVPNAKCTNGRANGPMRRLDLTDLVPKLIAMIERQLAFAAQFSSLEDFRRAHAACRKCLYKTTRALWPKRQRHVCLYTSRHQFAANAKADGLSRGEVAALMGHASDETASLHYGRRTSGRAGFAIRPNPTEVELVRRKAESRGEYIARKLAVAKSKATSQSTR